MSGIAGSRGKTMLNLRKLPNFSKVAYSVHIHTSKIYKGSIFLHIFSNICHFLSDYSYFCGYAVLSHCRFTLHFPD